MEAITKQWFDDLKGAAAGAEGLNAIGKKPVSTPALDAILPKPQAPAFIPPPADRSVASRITGIKDLKGLEALAQASAYDKYIKGGGTNSLKDFLDEAETKNNVDGVKDIVSGSKDSDSDIVLLGRRAAVAASPGLGDEWSPSDGARGVEVDEAGGGAAGAAAANEDFPEYTVMGVWIASWSQLFPWLVSGHDNQVPRNSQPVGMFKLRRLQQDFLTLARLYRKFARNSNLTVQPMTPNITFEQLADDFTAGASKISDFIAGGIAKTDGPAPDPLVELQARLRNLNSYSKAIFKTWSAFPCVRNAGLGLGITVDIPGYGSKLHSFKAFWTGDNRQNPQLSSCPFEPDIANYRIFSDYIKGWPLIFTDKNKQGRVVCYVEGPHQDSCGILRGIRFTAVGTTISSCGTEF